MQKKQYSAVLYIAPILLFFIVFLLYPLVYTVRVSFYEWNGLDDIMNFIGWDNYKELLKDPLFFKSLQNYIVFGVLVVGIQMLLGFLLAYLMRRGSRIFTLYKTIIFIPVITTPVVISYIFNNILAFDDGLVNRILRGVGLKSLAISWMADPHIALYTIIAVTVWAGTGFSMSVYVSALTSLTQEVLDAALIDGANKRQTIMRVVWPMLRDTHYSLTIIGAISALKIFDIIYLLTRGGPLHSTEMLSTYMFNKAFSLYEQGFASTIATVIILFAVVITIIQLRLSRNSNV